MFAEMIKRKNIYAVVIVAILSILILEYLNNKKSKHPYTGLNIIELSKKYGYPIEIHELITEDGYILTLHRIPYGRGNTGRKKKTPILFMHGFMQSAIDFIHLGPGKALTLLLADQGYDIWLGNARGSTWSRRHIHLNPDKDIKYWDFSLHEIGFHDVSTFIDHILETTGEKTLQYVGFSQGTTFFFILMSEKPQYAEKVSLMTALAPAVFLKNPESPLLKIAVYFRRFIETFLLDIFSIREFLSHDSLLSIFTKQICNENSIFVNLCLKQFFVVHGFNMEGANKSMLSLIYSNTPAGVSTKQMMHVVQLMESGKFQKYNLGVGENIEKYGKETPPLYDLSKATTPVALYYSSNDWTINIKNVKNLSKTLPNVIKSYQIPCEKFNHDDFVHSDAAPDLVYNVVMEVIAKYQV